MARIKGPRKVHRYSAGFKLKAVKLSSLAGVLVQDVAAVLVVLPTPTFVGVAAILTAFAGSAVSTRSELSRPFNPGFVIAISLGAVAIVGLFLLALTSGEPVGRPIPGWGRALLGVALALLLGAELLRYLRLKRRTAAA